MENKLIAAKTRTFFMFIGLLVASWFKV